MPIQDIPFFNPKKFWERGSRYLTRYTDEDEFWSDKLVEFCQKSAAFKDLFTKEDAELISRAMDLVRLSETAKNGATAGERTQAEKDFQRGVEDVYLRLSKRTQKWTGEGPVYKFDDKWQQIDLSRRILLKSLDQGIIDSYQQTQVKRDVSDFTQRFPGVDVPPDLVDLSGRRGAVSGPSTTPPRPRPADPSPAPPELTGGIDAPGGTSTPGIPDPRLPVPNPAPLPGDEPPKPSEEPEDIPIESLPIE